MLFHPDQNGNVSDRRVWKGRNHWLLLLDRQPFHLVEKGLVVDVQHDRCLATVPMSGLERFENQSAFGLTFCLRHLLQNGNGCASNPQFRNGRSEEHTSELQ